MPEASGPPSTPPAATPLAAEAAAAPAVAAPVASPAASPAPQPAPAAAPQTGSESVAPVAGTPPAEAALFALPEDFRPPETVLAKLTESVKGKLADGKVVMSPQDVADLFVGVAREAGTVFDKAQADLKASNAAACKARFDSTDLAASETAIGYFSSYSPGFADFAHRQSDDPEFVNAMRIVGEMLAEDTLGAPAPPAPSADNRPLRERAAAKLYGRKAT